MRPVGKMNETNGASMLDPGGSALVNQFANLTPNDILWYTAPHVVLIDRVVTPIWYILGFIGNPISAKIWLSRYVASFIVH